MSALTSSSSTQWNPGPADLAEVFPRATEPLSLPPGLTEANDAALVGAARDGQGPAFDALIRRHQKRIFAMALRLTRVREDAEDIVQESFLKAFLNLGQFEGRSTFSTWLTRIAINEAMMLQRKKRTSPDGTVERSGADDESPLLDLPDFTPSPEEAFIRRERAEILRAAVRQLAPRKRAAIEMLELREQSMREITRNTNVSAAAVKSRVFHARKRLRRMLFPHFGSARRRGGTGVLPFRRSIGRRQRLGGNQ